MVTAINFALAAFAARIPSGASSITTHRPGSIPRRSTTTEGGSIWRQRSSPGNSPLQPSSSYPPTTCDFSVFLFCAQSGLPGIWVSVKVHHRDNQYHILAGMVDNAVGKSTCSTTSCTLLDGRPCMRVLYDTRQRFSHFNGKSVTKPFALLIVIGYSFCQFLLCRVEKFDSHRFACRSISLNTSLAGDDPISPRS